MMFVLPAVAATFIYISCLWVCCYTEKPTSRSGTVCLLFPLFFDCLHINLKHLLSCMLSSWEVIVLLCSYSYCSATTCTQETSPSYK